MYLLPGNPFSQAVEAYRDSGEALCSKGMHVVPPPFALPIRLPIGRPSTLVPLLVINACPRAHQGQGHAQVWCVCTRSVLHEIWAGVMCCIFACNQLKTLHISTMSQGSSQPL